MKTTVENTNDISINVNANHNLGHFLCAANSYIFTAMCLHPVCYGWFQDNLAWVVHLVIHNMHLFKGDNEYLLLLLTCSCFMCAFWLFRQTGVISSTTCLFVVSAVHFASYLAGLSCMKLIRAAGFRCI